MPDLAGFDAQLFLRRYWQRRPLLIRKAWREWRNPLAPDDLAGLACSADIESRLVLRQRRQWRLELGPFAQARFASLPRRNWTVLVQAVDHHVPAVAELLEAFRFIPDWRIDDVMVSYAVDGGGVGPHFDQYDVFLVQGLGRRRWQIGQRCNHRTALLPHDELKLLANFVPDQEWLLEPGDILYLPPRYAHHGVAVGTDCMTYSIGLRAPSRAELIGHWCDAVIDRLSEDDRFVDAELIPAENSGEITATSMTRLYDMLVEALLDKPAFTEWFAGYVSERKYPEQQPPRRLSTAQIQQRLARGAALVRHPASRYSLIRNRQLVLFVDGQRFACRGRSAALAELLCGHDRRPLRAADVRAKSALELVSALYNQRSMIFTHV